LGAAALFEGKWRHIEQEIRNLITHYFPGPIRPDELHFAPLRQGKREYRSLTRVQRQSLLTDFCSIVTNLLSNEIALFTVVADKAYWFLNNPGKSGDDLSAR